ncbi:unnamed protein product [Camellia sinensis]
MGVVVGMMESGMVMSRDPKPRLRWTADLHDRFVVPTETTMCIPQVLLPIHQEEVPIAEALRCQIQVQKRLQEHLEVQKKLQMRIEAQGKYLQSILEKAQKSPTLDMNSTISLEATRDSLTNFNLALSNLMANMDGESRNENISEKSVLFIQRKSNGSLCLGEEQEKKDIKLKVEGSCINFDLNTRGSYDFFGANGSELEVKKTLAYGS